MVVRLRGDKGGNMEAEIRTPDAVGHIILVEQISEFHKDSRRADISLKELPVFIAVPDKNHKIVEFTDVGQHGLEALIAHAAAGTGHKYSRLHLILPSCR